MVRINIIGAGSMAWSMVLVKDLCLTKSLGGSTVSFMDVDRRRLEVVHGLAKRYAKEVKAKLLFEKTVNRKEALRDADFVFSTALAGGHINFETQRNVAEKHRYYRGIDSVDHNMVSDYPTIGGYNQLKLCLDIARDMEDICPDAWLIQTANPLFEICCLLTRETKVKVIGLCHGHFGYGKVAKTLGLDLKKVNVESIGFNHCIWMTSFKYDGQSAYSLLDEWIKTKAHRYWKNWKPKYYDVDMSPAAVDMYKRFGLFPIGDTARSGGWKYHTDLITKKKWYGPLGGFDSEIGWSRYQADLRRQLNRMCKICDDASVSVTAEFPPMKSGEQHVPIIDAIVNDREGMFQVNVPNGGAVDGVPSDVVVEVPALVGSRGVQRLHVGRLPERLMLHVIVPRMLRMEWALEAYLEGGRDLLTEWLLSDPRTKSFTQAEETIKEILALPFNKEMSEHYK
jgi:alpha-galactosidase